MIERADGGGADAGSRVGHVELHTDAAAFADADVHVPALRELERVGREIEQHAAQGPRVSLAAVHHGLRETHLEALFFRRGSHQVAHRREHAVERERHGLDLAQPVTPRQLEHVARGGAQAERGTVNQSELPPLALGHGAATALGERLGEHEDRAERRAQVVRHLHHEIEPVAARQVVGEIVRSRVRLTRGGAPPWRSLERRHANGGSSPASGAASPRVRSGSMIQPAFGLRWSPWRSMRRYSVVRSTPAMRAALDMLPPARFTSQVRYWVSNWPITRP